MYRNYFHLSSLLLLATLFTVGCAMVGVEYVGELSFSPTTTVDVYFSVEDIERGYTIMGQVLGTGPLGSNDKIQEKLIEEAKRRGADAVVITGLDTLSGDNSTKSQINALSVKYK